MPARTPDFSETIAASLSDCIVHLVQNHVTETFRQRLARNEMATMFLTVASHAEREQRIDIAKMMHSYASKVKPAG